MSTIDTSYYDILAKIESGNRPNVKASTSSASGLFQFVKKTGQQYGLPWGNDPTKAFGGANVTVEQQYNAIKKFTEDNANRLRVAINNATLYAAHFLGADTANKILSQPLDTPVEKVLSPAVIKANPFLKGMTVKDFGNWLKKKTGADPFQAAVLKTK